MSCTTSHQSLPSSVVHRRPARASRLGATIAVIGGSIILTVATADPAAAAGTCNGLTVTIQGTAGPDNLTGTAGPDVVDLLGGNDTVNTLGGNDTICAGTGTKTIDGGSERPAFGGDTVVYAGFTDALTVDLSLDLATGFAVTHRLFGIEHVVGGGGSDTLIGDDARNRLNGAAGNDTIKPSGGDDIVIGGPGNRDRVDFSDSLAGITADLTTGSASGDGTDAISSTEDITGSAFRDSLTGSAVANRIDAGPNDTITAQNVIGGAGDDVLTGSETDDLLVGGAGADTLNGLGGSDWLYAGVYAATADTSPNTLNGGEGNDNLQGDLGDDTINGGPGDDDEVWLNTATAGVTVTLAAPASSTGMGADALTGVEQVVGSRFDDDITGNGLANRLDGGAGDDTVRGGGGDDFLIGGEGSDSLVGGAGTDTCAGYGGSVGDDQDPDTATGCEILSSIP